MNHRRLALWRALARPNALRDVLRRRDARARRRAPPPFEYEERAVYVVEGSVEVPPERIEQAEEDWREGRFSPVPGESERSPVPQTGPAVVRYP
ncbi:MAG TPA: hypothetical protein VF621_06025 [Pyrinomonadaceae bacterium]